MKDLSSIDYAEFSLELLNLTIKQNKNEESTPKR